MKGSLRWHCAVPVEKPSLSLKLRDCLRRRSVSPPSRFTLTSHAMHQEASGSPIDPGMAWARPSSDDEGDRDALYAAAYDELRRLAGVIARSDPGATINPTALVNEAWLKLAATPGLAPASPLHLRRIAGRAMRQVLVEAARRRHAEKRGGPDAVLVTFDEGLDGVHAAVNDIVALDTVLEELAAINPRQAAMIESRFFGGLDVAETAALLGVSEATILRDWRVARAWLADALHRHA